MPTHDWLLGGIIAFALAAITTPTGVSGAVFMLPVQVSLLHVPSPALTPTNLLYNVLATPGALIRFGREGRLGSPLTRKLILGTLPGVVIGAVLRVEVLSGPRAFLLVVAAVLGPLGAWLALFPARPASAGQQRQAGAGVTALALVVGTIGGIYGIGGGSLLGPLLASMGFSLYVVAPAALTSTFLTSVVGVGAYQLLQLINADSAIAPEWGLGAAMGVGGICGSYVGARLQTRIPEPVLRRLLGVVSLALAGRYLLQATGLS
jgi:uncharacterized membrane protein YfcA